MFQTPIGLPSGTRTWVPLAHAAAARRFGGSSREDKPAGFPGTQRPPRR